MNRILATFMFFTRLPLWKIANPPAECFKRVVPLWPMVGWLTGTVMTAVYLLAINVFAPTVAIAFALLSRVLLTGALHEDGFADFCDGFGGGTTRERTLAIMKDSHIGTYGVLGLIMYFILMVGVIAAPNRFSQNSLFALPMLTFVIADTFCKWASSTIIYALPYARNEETAKSKLVYSSVSLSEKVTSLLIGIAPLLLAWHEAIIFLPSCAASLITCLILFQVMKRRINGYTGDCCGATFIISEFVFYVMLAITASCQTSLHCFCPQ